MALDLTFSERELRALCLNPSIAIQKLDHLAAKILRHRLADMAAVSVVADLFLLPGNLHEINTQPDILVLELTEGWHIKFTSGHVRKRTLSTGRIDWKRVRRIKILDVEKWQ